MAAGKVPVPKALKPIQPYLVIAKQFSNRDPVVRYYASMYAVQVGLEAKSDPDAKTYLLQLMDELDGMKKEYSDNDAIRSNEIAKIHIEEVALKLFDVADSKDKQAIFDKPMMRSFFTASQLFTILKQFGELSEEIDGKMKYAKWKAVEIDRCLKNGITPTPGPPGGNTDDEGSEQGGGAIIGGAIGFNIPSSDTNIEKPVPKPRHNVVPHVEPTAEPYQPPAPSSQAALGPAEIAKAQKLFKFAGSALDYDDTVGAIEYLEEALKLLKTGK